MGGEEAEGEGGEVGDEGDGREGEEGGAEGAGADITVVLSFVAGGCGLQPTATNASETSSDERIIAPLYPFGVTLRRSSAML